jgi:hypothetical protein
VEVSFSSLCSSNIKTPPPFHLIMTTTKIATTLTIAAVFGVALLRVVRKARKASPGLRMLRKGDELAQVFVETDLEVQRSWEVEDTPYAVSCVEDAGGKDAGAIKPAAASLLESGTVKYSRDRLEVKNHKVVRNKAKYSKAVLAEAKIRFGTPSMNNANVLAVRRYVVDIMEKHGVRPSHIAEMAPLIVGLCFVKSDAERDADNIVEYVRLARGTWVTWAKAMVGYAFGRSRLELA